MLPSLLAFKVPTGKSSVVLISFQYPFFVPNINILTMTGHGNFFDLVNLEFCVSYIYVGMSFLRFEEFSL